MNNQLKKLKNLVDVLSIETMKTIEGGDFVVRIYGDDGQLERSFFVDTNGDGGGMPYDNFINGGGEFNWNGVVAEASGSGYYAGTSPSGDPNGPWWDNRNGTNSYTNPLQLSEVSVRPQPPSEWSKFAFGVGGSAYANLLGFQAEIGGSFVYFPYSSSVAGYIGSSAGISPSLGAGASIDAKPYIFYSMNKQPLQFSTLKGWGEQVSVTFADASGSVVWGRDYDSESAPLTYVGIGVGPGAGASGSYSISWYDGYHIITVPTPYGPFPIPIADRPDVIFPEE